jgi:hypothetical protein
MIDGWSCLPRIFGTLGLIYRFGSPPLACSRIVSFYHKYNGIGTACQRADEGVKRKLNYNLPRSYDVSQRSSQLKQPSNQTKTGELRNMMPDTERYPYLLDLRFSYPTS